MAAVVARYLFYNRERDIGIFMGSTVFSEAGNVSMGPGLRGFWDVAIFGSPNCSFISIHACLGVFCFA